MMPPSQKPQDTVRAMPMQTGHSIALYRRIVTFFLLMTVVVAVLVAYVVLSRASVVIMAKQEEASGDFIVDIAGSPSSGEVQGQILQAEEVLSDTFPSSSVVKIDAPASGKVKISSTLFRSQTLIATTRLLTPDGVLFRLNSTVVVPANGSVIAEVHADAPGASGNVTDTTFTIPGLNPDTARFFKAVSVEPFTGGVKDQHMLTKTDIDTAANTLLEKLKVTLGESLHRLAKEAGKSSSGETISYDITRKVTDKPVGDDSDSFKLTVTVKATGVFYDAQAFDDQVRANLTDKLPLGRSLLAVEQEGMKVEVEKLDLEAGRANLHVVAKGTTTLAKDSPALRKDKLLGISVDAAKKYLERTDGVSSASVTVSPFWIGRLPNVPEHITIEVR